MFFIKKQAPRPHALGEPILHENHRRPVTRRELLGAGLRTAPAVVLAPAWLGAALKSGRADAGLPLSTDISGLAAQNQCNVASIGTGLIPFICFDLAGGANLVGSEVIVGQQGGQQNFLTTSAYGKMGLPGNMVPSVSATFVSNALGLLWHSDGAILRGIQTKADATAQAGTDGAVICGMSQNDTSTNPHNPMYGIMAVANSIGKKGQLLNLIGTDSSVSGGNSQAPMYMVQPQWQPATIQQPQDATALVPTSGGTVSQVDVAVMESQVRISGGTAAYSSGSNSGIGGALAAPSGGTPGTLLYTPGTQQVPNPNYQAMDGALKQQLRCAYVQSTNTAAAFNDPSVLDPTKDPNIQAIFGPSSTWDRDTNKTASVMKLVLNGFAAAGTIAMGGYDYHDSTRASGEMRNFKAGTMIGAVLQYAKLVGKPVMIYVMTDGSLTSSSMVDTSTAGRNKLAWQGDNESVSSTFFLVYNPAGRAALRGSNPNVRQIGYFSADGAVVSTASPAANSVVQMAEAVVLNYMSLHSQFDSRDLATVLPGQGIGSSSVQASMKVFAPIHA